MKDGVVERADLQHRTVVVWDRGMVADPVASSEAVDLVVLDRRNLEGNRHVLGSMELVDKAHFARWRLHEQLGCRVVDQSSCKFVGQVVAVSTSGLLALLE